jgi:hypothetical protein
MQRRVRQIGILATSMLVAMVMVLATPAYSACHIAAFEKPTYSVDEDDGSVTLKVILVNKGSTCGGTVTYNTKDGTAKAGQDFQAKSGTLTFEVGDDREETITITIIDDSTPESSEKFTVELSNPTGTITDTGSPASVTILDDDEEPEPDPSPTRTRQSPSPESSSPEPTGSPTPSEESPTPGAALEFGEEAVTETAGDDDGGLPTAAVVSIIGVLIAAGAAIGLWLLQRRKAAAAE